VVRAGALSVEQLAAVAPVVGPEDGPA